MQAVTAARDCPQQQFVVVLPWPVDLAAQGKLECLLTPKGEVYLELPLLQQAMRQA